MVRDNSSWHTHLVSRVVSIHIRTHYECGGGHHASVCVYIYMPYDTHTHWRTGEERADPAGAKCEGGCTYGNDAVFDFPTTP
jgi:hypothetical protein